MGLGSERGLWLTVGFCQQPCELGGRFSSLGEPQVRLQPSQYGQHCAYCLVRSCGAGGLLAELSVLTKPPDPQKL